MSGQTVDVARTTEEWAEVRLWIPKNAIKPVDSSEAVGLRYVENNLSLPVDSVLDGKKTKSC